MTREVPLTGNSTAIALPAEFATANVMVEGIAGGIRKSQAYFANRLGTGREIMGRKIRDGARRNL